MRWNIWTIGLRAKKNASPSYRAGVSNSHCSAGHGLLDKSFYGPQITKKLTKQVKEIKFII
jgi:hypothetical protein